jgi:hypothetical protein
VRRTLPCPGMMTSACARPTDHACHLEGSVDQAPTLARRRAKREPLPKRGGTGSHKVSETSGHVGSVRSRFSGSQASTIDDHRRPQASRTLPRANRRHEGMLALPFAFKWTKWSHTSGAFWALASTPSAGRFSRLRRLRLEDLKRLRDGVLIPAQLY